MFIRESAMTVGKTNGIKFNDAMKLATIFAVVGSLVACGDDSDSPSNAADKDDGREVAAVIDMGRCTSEREGDTVYVAEKMKDYICRNRTWVDLSDLETESDLVVTTFGDLPVCSSTRKGVTAYVKGEKTAYVCEDGNWEEDVSEKDSESAEVSSNSKAKSSSSKKASLSSSSKRDEEYSAETLTSSSSSNKISSSSISSSSYKKSESSSSGAEPAKAIMGSLTDSRDGQIYRTVRIGKQEWMAQNLNYEIEASYCYKKQDSNCVKYGRLYTWAEAMDSAAIWSSNGAGCGYAKTCSPIYPVRGVCPEGWHLPRYMEWESLFDAVGGRSIAGMVLKSASGWSDGGNGTDDFSFTILPAGDGVSYGSGINEGQQTYFWLPTEKEGNRFNAEYVRFYSTSDNTIHLSLPKSYGFSIRCVKDELSKDLSSSSVVSKSSSSRGAESVKESSSSVVRSSSSAKPVSVSSSSSSVVPKSSSSSVEPVKMSSSSVVRSSSSAKPVSVSSSSSSVVPKSSSSSVEPVKMSSSSVVRSSSSAKPVSVSSSSSSSMPKSSSSLPRSSSSWSETIETESSSSLGVVDPSTVIKGSMTDSRDGQTYKTVQIGTQTWMAQNLNYETEDSYCYGDSLKYCIKYGRYYTWAAAKIACPSGWHLPTRAEFETLSIAVGGDSTAGIKLKSTSGWRGGNGADAYFFSALPAGFVSGSTGRLSVFVSANEGWEAYFWSIGADYMSLKYNSNAASLDGGNMNDGFSVRCVKD